MICSFCATQLPADAVYCAECGRPAMSRRARRSADTAPKRTQSARSKRVAKKAQVAESLNTRHHLMTDRAEEVSPVVASSSDTAPVGTAAFRVQNDGAVVAEKYSSAARADVGDEIQETPRSDAEAREPAEPEPAASASALQLGDPLALEDIAENAGTSAHSTEPVDAAELESRVVDGFAGDSDAIPATDADVAANANPLPHDEEGPYDEVLPSGEHGRSTTDGPVETSTGILNDHVHANDDESQTTDEYDARNANAAALQSADLDIEPEVKQEVAAAHEPEPLVEPSPLQRSPFEPDLSKVGRPEAAMPVQDRSPVRSVRPLGDEPVFTTAERLRASAFAPVASERVSDQPAPPNEPDDSASAVASVIGTAPRISEAFGVQQGDAVTGRNGVPRSDDGPGVDRVGTSNHAPSQEASARSASPEAVCAQCGGSLSELDIFCGFCGLVRNGVGPISRSNSAPVLDPFPWGTPTVRASTAEADAEPDRRQEQAAADEPAGVIAQSEEAALAEEAAQLQNAELEPHSTPVLLDEDLSLDEGLSQDVNVTHGDHEVGARTQNADADNAVARGDSAEAESDPGFEPLNAIPHPSNGEGQSDVDDVKSSAPNAQVAAAPGSSVLAPPPMSHHRVELPIAPPTPLASVASDEEDIEDTRIVERSISGTRFVLQFSTGDSVIVTGTGLVGRNPIPEPSEKFDIVVPITDPSKSVSKTHLEFGQMAGAFWISDRYSGNGSVVREPGAEPKRCEPGKRYRVMRGTRVEIGEQFFIVS